MSNWVDMESYNLKQEEQLEVEENLTDVEWENYALESLEITESDYFSYDTDYEDFFDEICCVNCVTIGQVIERTKQENRDFLHIQIEEEIEIPKEIGKLKKLKRLIIENISTRCVLSLPSEIGNLTNLEYFSAYGCNMVELPKEFSKLINLKSLNLNDNNFKVFPKEILQLKKLESLAINFNFEILPDEICDLIRLKYLYLPEAKIEYLPENIGNLQDLEVLCLWGTKIKKLPESCLNLSKIKSLSLTRSIFKDILPPEIINQSPLEAINYIIKYHNDAKKVEVYESKMIIVGQGGVGKTCLLNRLIYDKYDETVSTDGIDIEFWKFNINNNEYKLNVWDFGGQEIYHATHQFFLTNRSLYIFVWDARQEEEYGRIDYWLHTIESFANDSPIIIVVNKCDSRTSIRQLDLKSIKEKFPQVIDSYKVSCKENVEIDHLRNVIKEETTKLPLMGMTWLSSWLEVKFELEKLSKSKNIIKYEQYQQICDKYNISSDDALSLSKYLHDLGIIINFQNDLYLKNIVILNPDWGTNAVYKVLDAQETVLKNRNGILRFKDLKEIWKDFDEYPEEVYPIILRLMENFQLSFEINRNEEYLIAELLENEEITYKLDVNDRQCLNFQYNYEFLPAGFITKFIVKAHMYLAQIDGRNACWKKGAYLKYGDSVGIVKLIDGIAKRKIEIKIFGENRRTNRDLLVIIRKYFDEIHKNVPKIKYTEYVKCNCKSDCTYLHDYKYLLKLEEKNIQEERCRKSFELVKISKLLDGVDDEKYRKANRRKNMNSIQINPHITVENYTSNNNENNNENMLQNQISIQIRAAINELQGNINDLKDEVIYENQELEKEFNKIDSSLDRLSNVKTKDEIIKSGVLNKVKRFLEEIMNSESDIGKIVKNLKCGVVVMKEIIEKYNYIAEWCGFPIISKMFL